MAPRFEGDNSYIFNVAPIISLGKVGPQARFSSRNDNVSFAFIDKGSFRAGAAGKLLFERDEDASEDLKGLDPVRFGGEAGGFAEIYPTDWVAFAVRFAMAFGATTALWEISRSMHSQMSRPRCVCQGDRGFPLLRQIISRLTTE